MKISIRFAARIVALSLTLSSFAAAAQVYVRPSKGRAMTVMTVTGAVNSQTQLYDWTGFEAAQITIAGVINLAQTCTVSLMTSGSTQSSGIYLAQAADVNGLYTNSAFGSISSQPYSYSYNVSNLPPYVQFTLTTSAGCATSNVVVVPIPFNTNISVTLNAAASTVAVVEAPACSSPCTVASNSVPILNTNGIRHSAIICAVGTVTNYCCYAATCTTTTYDVILKAASGAADGSGGCLSISGTAPWGGVLTCAGTAGGKVSVVAY